MLEYLFVNPFYYPNSSSVLAFSLDKILGKQNGEEIYLYEKNIQKVV